MNILTHPTLGVITLPDGLIYEDLLRSHSYKAATSYGLDGSLFILSSKVKAGLEINLLGGSDYGYITGQQLLDLNEFMLDRKIMVLNYQGVNYNVLFNYSRNPLSATKVQLKHINSTDDIYNNVVLSFIKV
jgi:hypothetical protein